MIDGAIGLLIGLVFRVTHKYFTGGFKDKDNAYEAA
jgi:hypothetical protein